MNNRDEIHLRDRLLLLAECSNPHRPFNVKRKSTLNKQSSKTERPTPKLSVQDFVRMDPGYTPDIEHLVFPIKKRSSPQQVAPINPPPTGSKTRSRLVEMFALSRHLQQRSTDRDNKSRNALINRSIDSVLDSRMVTSTTQSTTGPSVVPRTSGNGSSSNDIGSTRRWVNASVEEPVRTTSNTTAKVSPVIETDMATTRGPNVSILHLRSTSEPWETSPPSVYTTTVVLPSTTRPITRSSGPTLTKHQSLGGGGGYSTKWATSSSSNFHSGDGINTNTTELFANPTTGCNRELSPVRWCDREVDGVYLGRSGWVQVQQRSLDENRRTGYATTSSLQPSRRTGIKLADYHCNSEPSEIKEPQRPAYLSLQPREYERKSPTPSPRHDIPENLSPPLITPIISPPPAFQDKNKPKTRTFFGKMPILNRSNAIVDDLSPPLSPIKWEPSSSSNITSTTTTTTSTIQQPTIRKSKNEIIQEPTRRIPQTKSMEDTTTNRRNQFLQRYGESSSSSSSSMGFRSLDSCMNRPIMPRLSENTDSSIDIYEDADEEDNNSSSINISISTNSTTTTTMNQREKVSPSSRNNRVPYHRQQTRRSPAGSDTNKPPNSPGSSSTSSNEFPLNSRRTQNRQFQSIKTTDDSSLQRVRRSRSLQLPDRKPPQNYRDMSIQRVSPQHPERSNIKMGTLVDRNKRYTISKTLDEEIIREAEVVTGFVYGSRTRQAAQALLMQRYNNNMKEEKSKETTKSGNNNGLTVYFVGNSKKDKTKILHRGVTTPTNLPSVKSAYHQSDVKRSCTSDTCDFWPHCAHRDSLQRESQFMMRSSQSYPTHQRSLDEKQLRKSEVRRISPNRGGIIPPPSTSSTTSPVTKRTEPPKKLSPNNQQISTIPGVSSSSSSSDIWLTTSDRTVTKSPKNVKSSGASTPLEEMSDGKTREMILTRPGSAPTDENRAKSLEAQQRSLSLPKSFLSASYQPGGQFPWRKRGTDSLASSPGVPRKVNSVESSHTAPVTPLHETNRRRSPLPGSVAPRRTKATSTPQLLEAPPPPPPPPSADTRNWNEKTTIEHSNTSSKDLNSRRNQSGHHHTSESVLQKFRKRFSLSFQKKSSKDSLGGSSDGEILNEPSEEESSPQRVPSVPTSNSQQQQQQQQQQLVVKDEQQSENKNRFGPLIWRSSKEQKKLNKAARSVKCNSGDSGIQIEMVSSCGGGSGGGGGGGSGVTGDSSESHDTDPPGDDLDSPPSIRKRNLYSRNITRPHSELLNQILIDKLKSDLKQRAYHRHNQVRRTRSDLGGQRLLNWDPRSTYKPTTMSSLESPIKGQHHHPHQRDISPHKRTTNLPSNDVQMRLSHHRRGHLRRSLSQPLDIDKLSPLMRTKTAGLRLAGSRVLSEDDHDGRLGTSDDEMMSDSESSIASINDRKKSIGMAIDEEIVILAEAVFDHVAIEIDELAFRAGDVIEILQTAHKDWWWGKTANGKKGWFPAQFVRLRVSQEDTVEDCLAAMASGQTISSSIRRRTSISLLSNDQVRTSIVRELVHTERDFVKVLQDLCEGYVAECRKRKDMFNDEQISTIFINIEDILRFQSGFLKDLEAQIDWEQPYKSCVGGCFLKHKAGFKIYSEYCNSHPMATASLQELYQYNNYCKFFEACRLMRGLIEIPLHGYLLTPVQRICKYPLQLAELLKYTKPEHCDYNDIKEALDVMRDVAVLINERKRRMESLEKLAAWQQRVECWEGEDLIEISSQLIHQGEVVRVTTGMWTNNITLFLFDHQIVYCKKDILKRNTYIYKGRICLDTSEVIDVPDGKDNHLGVSVRHAIKLYSCIRDKWLLFCCRSSHDKDRWLQAFQEERRLVAQDRDDGLEFPAAAKQLARITAKCQKRPPRKPKKNYNKHETNTTRFTNSNLQLNSKTTTITPTSSHSNSLGRKVGTWFTFGGHKKSRHRDVS